MSRFARSAAWALVVAGVLLGLTTAGMRPSEPRHHGDAVVLAVDFHVHSFPGDGALPPWDIAVEAGRRGLDAVALTNHNHRLQWQIAALVPWHPRGAMLIEGEELTARGYHLALVGTRTDVPWRQTAAAAAIQAQAAGGVAIAAHPAGDSAKGLDDAAIDVLDGVEAAHPIMYDSRRGREDLAEFYARARARRPSIAAIGSTDFHFFAPIGFCRTFVFARERSAAGILEAVRRGATVACDASGNTFGPADLSAVVAEACRAAAGAPAIRTSWADPVGATSVGVGLVLLVVLGAEEREGME